MRAWVSWSIWAFLMLVFLSMPCWFAWTAVRALPHARGLASAYAASPDCEPSSLLRAAAPQHLQRASSSAPAGALCQVQPMTVQEKRHISSRHSSDRYSVTLSDEAGRPFVALLDPVYWLFWRDLPLQTKVNVQLVEGNVTMIADGAKLARTTDYPESAIRSLHIQLSVSGLFSIPFFVLLGLSIKGWVKKSRHAGSGANEPGEMEARARRDSTGAALPMFDCPNFQGRPLAQARKELEAAGYKVGRITFIPSPSSAVGTIVAQTPAPGSQVDPGTAFDSQVSIEAKTPPSNS